MPKDPMMHPAQQAVKDITDLLPASVPFLRTAMKGNTIKLRSLVEAAYAKNDTLGFFYERACMTVSPLIVSAWGANMGVYRIQPDLYAELVKTPVMGEIPSEVFEKTPEWCVFIETPGYTTIHTQLNEEAKWHGFWAAVLENESRGKCLAIVGCTTCDSQPTFRLELKEGMSVEEAFDQALSNSYSKPLDENSDALCRKLDASEIQARAAGVKKELTPLISLFLYLCSTNAEITAAGTGARFKPGLPEPRLPSGRRVPKKWDVGLRIGAALKKALAEPSDADQTKESLPSNGKGSAPRAHIRRAHWHGFWVGSKSTPDARKLVLKWIPPIPVNMGELDELPVVVRTVGGAGEN